MMLLLAFAITATSPTSTSGTAFVKKHREMEVGVFQPLRYGVAPKTELSTQPLLNFLIPNLAFKRQWLTYKGLHFATRHNLSVPTPLLRAISREGAGGVLGADTQVPWIVSLNNEVYATHQVGRASWLSGKLGVAFAARMGHSTLPSIDLPLVYTRTAHYRRPYTLNAGFDLDGKIGGDWTYTFDADFLWVSARRGRYAIEQSTMLGYATHEGGRLVFGYKAVIGDYPFGLQTHILPLVDYVWAWDV